MNMEPTVKRRMIRNLLAALVLFGGYALYLVWSHNFHEVVPGELYRSAQLWNGDIARYGKQYGIRSIINLRGDNTGSPWYDDEVSETKAAGIEHIDFRMSSKRVLTHDQLMELIDTMRRAPKPVLIHCQAGANRTSLAVAIYLAAIKKADERTAESQMSIRFGNFPEWLGSKSRMSRNFEMIEEMLGYEDS